MSTRQFRYSTASFRSSVLAALGLTLMVTFLVWIFAQLFGVSRYNSVTIISGLIFFGFCSAAMVLRYLRRDVIVAARPDGLFDARYKSSPVPWETIKDLRLGRIENEFQIAVFLWPRHQTQDDERPAFVIDLAPLDAGVEQVVTAINNYRPVTFPTG